ncbi:MAG: beta strand repeat-containing protein [Solirubrobacteraceae bacterium]
MRSRLRRLLIRAPIPVAVLLSLAAGAWAYFSSTGTGHASNVTATLTVPSITSATPGPATASLSWTSVTGPGSGTVSYYVTRDGGAPAGNCPTSSSPSSVTSCTDSGLSLTTHNYTVTAVWRSWTATSTASPVQVTYGPATRLLLSPSSTTPNAGSADNLTITALDAYGDTVASYTGSHSLTFGGASVIGGNTPTVVSASGSAVAFGTATSLSFTNGVATVSSSSNGVMTLYKAETASITVSDGSISNGTGTSVTVSPLSASSLQLGASSTTPAAGATDNLTITAQDTYGNTATSYTGSESLVFGGPNLSPTGVHPTVTNYSGSAISFGSTTTISFSSGVATVSSSSNGVMTLYKAETASITVSDGSISNGTGTSVTVSPTAAAGVSLSAASTTPTAGSTDNVTVTSVDTYGNTVTSYNGSTSATFSGASTIGTHHPTVSNSSGTAIQFGSSTTLNFVSGVASVSGSNNGVMILYKAESASINVTTGSFTSNTVSVTVSPGSLGALALSAATQTPTAGASDNLTIISYDSYGNTLTTSTGPGSVTFSGASTIGSYHPTVTNNSGSPVAFGSSTTLNFTNGVSTTSGSSNGVMTLCKAESASITATLNGVTSNSLSVTVSPTSAAGLSLSAASTTPPAGAADNLTVTSVDSFGNTVTSFNGTTTATFSGASAIGTYHPTVTNSSGTAIAFGSSTTLNFVNGVASVSGSSNGAMTLYKAETAGVTVTASGFTSNTLSVTVSAAGAANLGLNATSTTLAAGASDNLTVSAADTYTNPITGSLSATFSGANTIGSNHPTVSNSSGTAIQFGSATTLSFSNGIAFVSGSNNGVMKLYKAETASVAVTINGASSSPVSITVSPGTAAALSLGAASTTPAAGAADNLTITAQDPYGNTATSYTGSKSLTFGGASTSPSGAHPTVRNSSGSAINFGSITAITFSSGVATVSSSSNGVMTLVKAQSASITVSDGTVYTGTGLSVTVAAPLTPSSLAYVDNTTATADQVTGSTSANATVTATETAGDHVNNTYTAAAGAGGAFTINVEAYNGSSTHLTMTYSVVASDAYGNQSSAGTISFNDTK